MDITNAEEIKRPHRVTRTVRKKLEERMIKNHTVKSENDVTEDFNRFTGELADVRPDSIESERFYGKNRGTIGARREWLMSF